MAKEVVTILILSLFLCSSASHGHETADVEENDYFGPVVGPYTPCYMNIPFFMKPPWCFMPRPQPEPPQPQPQPPPQPQPQSPPPPVPPHRHTPPKPKPPTPKPSPSPSPPPPARVPSPPPVAPNPPPSPPSSPHQPPHPQRPASCRVATVLYDSCDPKYPEANNEKGSPADREFAPQSVSTGFMTDAAGCCLGVAVFTNDCRAEIRDLSFAKQKVFSNLRNECGN